MLFRFFTLIYDSASRGDIFRGVEVSVRHISARLTFKLGLALAIGFFAVAASRTSAAGIAGIDSHHNYAGQFGLVLDEQPELQEGPTAHSRSLAFLEPCPAAYSLEVLKSNAAPGAFGNRYESFADYVICVSPETRFLLSEVAQGATRVSACRSLATETGFALQRAARIVMLLPYSFDAIASHPFAIACRGQVDNPKIHTKEFLDFNGCVLWNFNRAKKVELPIAINQVRLPLDPVESFCLILAINDWNYPTPGKRHQVYFVNALEFQNTVIVGHCALRLEDRTTCLVALKAFDHFADCTYRHLSGQAESLAKFVIAQSVNRRLAKSPCLETNLGRKTCGGIELFHSCQEQGCLFIVRQELELQGQFHGDIVG